MIYLWIENNRVLTEPNFDLAKLNYGLERKPDREFTDDEWTKINGLARLINGELFLGYTDEEKREQLISEYNSEIFELKRKLADTDYIVSKIAEGVATKEEYSKQLEERSSYRARINELENLINR